MKNEKIHKRQPPLWFIAICGGLPVGKRGNYAYTAVLVSAICRIAALIVVGANSLIIRLAVYNDTDKAGRDGGKRPQADMEAETSLARISHRLERFYNIMQMNRCKVEEEKAELQTRKMPEGKLQELLRASGSQLDKLDFLIQAMVKTSRLETGVIILEKKQALFADTLTMVLNGTLASMFLICISVKRLCRIYGGKEYGIEGSAMKITVCDDSRKERGALKALLEA